MKLSEPARAGVAHRKASCRVSAISYCIDARAQALAGSLLPATLYYHVEEKPEEDGAGADQVEQRSAQLRSSSEIAANATKRVAEPGRNASAEA